MKAEPKWYVAQVLTGSEAETARRLTEAGMEAIAPVQVLHERRHGVWRLMRRTVRDHLFRGADAAYTLGLWANVRRGEKKNISPFKDKADLQFDTSFPYEVGVLRDQASQLFATVDPGTERYEELQGVVHALERFVSIDPALVRPDALLREFIGGGVYSY